MVIAVKLLFFYS